MKPQVCSISRVLAIVLLSGSLTPLLSNDPAPSIEQLAAELRALKAELLQVRMELERSRIARVETELSIAIRNRQQAEARERTVIDELNGFDRAGAESPSAGDDAQNREATRRELVEAVAREAGRRQEAGQNEARIARELQSAQQKITDLLNRAKNQ